VSALRVAVVSEFYPRARDPVLGIWAHRQALAARAAGADVRVLVLHRPVPPRDDPAKLRTLAAMVGQPRHATLDGLDVEYVPFVSPPRGRSYGSWGAWAAPSLRWALGRLHRRWPFELVHAHNAQPAGDAVRRARPAVPLVLSVHGGDVLFTALLHGEGSVRPALEHARLVLANSRGIEERCAALGARATRVVHPGAELPGEPVAREESTLVTLGHLVARKRHADVLRALAALRARRAGVRYLVIGDGPERGALERLARELGLRDAVEFAGQLAPDDALRRMGACTALVMPSVDEAFGVAYVEAMAAGLPAIGARGEPGPEEIAAAGEGLRLVAAGDADALAAEIEGVLAPGRSAELGRAARRTVEEHFTWEACGRATVAAYEAALR
jgi:glycosyltransferase involved in cell wall biosynthesis